MTSNYNIYTIIFSTKLKLTKKIIKVPVIKKITVYYTIKKINFK